MTVEVFSTFNQADLAWVKHLLAREKIPYFLRGENFNIVHPLVQPVGVFVPEDMADTARELLRDSVTRYGPSTTDADSPEDAASE